MKDHTHRILKNYVSQRNKNNSYKEPSLDVWREYYAMTAKEFSDTLNHIEYKSDPLFGIIDYTSDMNYFFTEKRNSRDCDDFARAWMTWAIHNNYDAQEVIITTERLFKDAHVITIINNDTEFFLCNYEIYGPFNSFEEALDDMKRWERYADGYIYEFGIFKKAIE